MKFFPSDWRADPALRCCSLEARGLWIDMLCIMHEADPRGHLLINGQPMTERMLASLTGTDESTVSRLQTELETAGVFSRSNKGVIYSRRMTRDEKLSMMRTKSGKKGGNSTADKYLVKKDNSGLLKQNSSKGLSLEARSQKLDISLSLRSRDNVRACEPPDRPVETASYPPDYTPEFEVFWRGWRPFDMAKGNKQPAQQKYEKARKEGVDHETIIAGRDRYLAYCHSSRCKTQLIATWLHQRGWEGDWSGAPTANAGRGAGYSLDDVYAKAMADQTHGEPEGREHRLKRLGILPDSCGQESGGILDHAPPRALPAP